MPSAPSKKQDTPFEAFKRLTEKVVSVPRKEIQKREEKWKKGAKERKHVKLKTAMPLGLFL